MYAHLRVWGLQYTTNTRYGNAVGSATALIDRSEEYFIPPMLSIYFPVGCRNVFGGGRAGSPHSGTRSRATRNNYLQFSHSSAKWVAAREEHSSSIHYDSTCMIEVLTHVQRRYRYEYSPYSIKYSRCVVDLRSEHTYLLNL